MAFPSKEKGRGVFAALKASGWESVRLVLSQYWVRLIGLNLLYLLCCLPVVITTTISVLLYFCITKYFYPLLVLLDVDIWANFKNACIMAVVEWRTTLQLLITAGLLDLMLLLFTYQALPFYIIILCAFNCLLGCSFVNQPFEKYFGSKKASEK